MLTLLRRCAHRPQTLRAAQTVNTSCYATRMEKRVAVVLAGCGVYDGSEVHEASAVLVHLSRGGASVSLRPMSSLVTFHSSFYRLNENERFDYDDDNSRGLRLVN